MMTTPRRLRRPIPRSRNPWIRHRTWAMARNFHTPTPNGPLEIYRGKNEGYTAIMDGRA